MLIFAGRTIFLILFPFLSKTVPSSWIFEQSPHFNFSLNNFHSQAWNLAWNSPKCWNKTFRLKSLNKKILFQIKTSHRTQNWKDYYDNLSRRLQPGYNYIVQTNDRQPLLISAVGRLRDYLPTADCCVGPGRRAPNPPSTLIPAVCCPSCVLKHSHPPTLQMAAARNGRRPTRGGTLLWSIATHSSTFVSGNPHPCGRPPGCLDCPLYFLLPVSRSANLPSFSPGRPPA